MLVGQHHRDDLTVYYLGEELFAAIIVAFNTFETREAMLLDYTAVKDITLKEGWLYRKMIITTENERMKYGTSKVLLSDFQTENFNYFIDGQKNVSFLKWEICLKSPLMIYLKCQNTYVVSSID